MTRLALALALLAATPARAEDPFIDGVAEHADGSVTLTAEAARANQRRLADLRAALRIANADAASARDTCAVRLRAAEDKRAEVEKRIAILESLPPPEAPSRWPWFAGGVGVGMVAAGAAALALGGDARVPGAVSVSVGAVVVAIVVAVR